jgi:hypothetical protein
MEREYRQAVVFRQPALLASTADRDRSIRVLQTSFVEGRLTKDELEMRVGQVLTARLFPEVMALICDLPVGIFGRLPAHPVTAAPPRTNRLAIAALVLGCLAMLFGAVALAVYAR